MSLIIAALIAVLPPCSAEDQHNCYFDASTIGNGVGHSYVDLNGTLIYPKED